MKIILILISLITSLNASSGSLYSFDINSVKTTALNWLTKIYPELDENNLKYKYTIANIEKESEKLLVTVFFSYPANSKHGTLYVCAKIDEYGLLRNYDKDIEAYKSANLFIGPVTEKVNCNHTRRTNGTNNP